MTFKLSQKSLDKLVGVHPDLVKVVKLAIEISTIDFTVGEGRRSIERQKELVASGASKTMNSRHLTGHAVDLYALKNGVVSWDKPLYDQLSKHVAQAAKELGIDVEWGGTAFGKFYDGPHYQLSWKSYPK